MGKHHRISARNTRNFLVKPRQLSASINNQVVWLVAFQILKFRILARTKKHRWREALKENLKEVFTLNVHNVRVLYQRILV